MHQQTQLSQSQTENIEICTDSQQKEQLVGKCPQMWVYRFNEKHKLDDDDNDDDDNDWGGCGSAVEPASCYWKVTSLIPRLHVKVSLGKTLNPKLILMCWSAPCMAATTISV